MLQDILDSKHASLILSFFLVAPERAFSQGELSSRLGIGPKGLNEGLQALVKQNMVSVFEKKREKYYLLNARQSLLPDVKNYLVKNQKKYDDELFSAIKKLGEIRAAFLSGIFTGQPQLPVDLLLVGKINLIKLDAFLINCKKLMGQEINYSIMSEDEFLLRRNTFDRFIKDIFDYRHLVVTDAIKYPNGKK